MSVENRLSRRRKPTKCPACGARAIADILYGLPALDDQLEKDLAENRVVLGGCCVTDDDPSWACTSCSTVIYRARAADPEEGGTR